MTRGKKPDARIRKLIEEATVDAYGEAEQEVGFLTMMEENLPFPFGALVVGEEVEVTAIDLGPGNKGVEAVCERKGRTYRISIISLQWPRKPPPGAEWIEAYRRWLVGDWGDC